MTDFLEIEPTLTLVAPAQNVRSLEGQKGSNAAHHDPQNLTPATPAQERV